MTEPTPLPLSADATRALASLKQPVTDATPDVGTIRALRYDEGYWTKLAAATAREHRYSN